MSWRLIGVVKCNMISKTFSDWQWYISLICNSHSQEQPRHLLRDCLRPSIHSRQMQGINDARTKTLNTAQIVGFTERKAALDTLWRIVYCKTSWFRRTIDWNAINPFPILLSQSIFEHPLSTVPSCTTEPQEISLVVSPIAAYIAFEVNVCAFAFQEFGLAQRVPFLRTVSVESTGEAGDPWRVVLV